MTINILLLFILLVMLAMQISLKRKLNDKTEYLRGLSDGMKQVLELSEAKLIVKEHPTIQFDATED